MKKTVILIALLLLLLPIESYGLRCGGKIIETGDTKTEVRAKCGEPDSIETEEVKTESRWAEKQFGTSHPDATDPRPGALGAMTTTTKIIETWTYDFGPQKLMRVLTFEGSKLITIEERDYGIRDYRSKRTISEPTEIVAFEEHALGESEKDTAHASNVNEEEYHVPENSDPRGSSQIDKASLVLTLQEMADAGELIIWIQNSKELISGDDIDRIELKGRTIQILVK